MHLIAKPWFPFASLEVVDKGRGKVLVVDVVGIVILRIGLEVGSEHCGLGSSSLNNLLQRIDAILILCDHLLTWKVDLKVNDIGMDCMHLILHQPSKGFALRDVACIQIELDLILTISKLHDGTVVTLVDIFIDVLDPSDGANALYIDS
jgi:hypothetical protein